MQDETRNIEVLRFGTTYIRDLTILLETRDENMEMEEWNDEQVDIGIIKLTSDIWQFYFNNMQTAYHN